MLRESLQIIQESFLKYKGTGMYIALFFIAMLYLFLSEKKKENRTFLVYFPCFILFIILNPIFQKCVNSLLNKNVYWRTFWMLPMGVVIAYASTKVVKSRNHVKHKVIVFITMITIIMVSGKLIYNKENYKKIDNFYKVPEEYVEVVNILSGATLKNKKVMVSSAMVPYIRQIDASLKLAFPRRAYGDYEKYEILQAYNGGDVEKLMKLCKEKQVNLLVYDKAIQITSSPVKFGFELYAQTENHDIYILNQKSK